MPLFITHYHEAMYSNYFLSFISLPHNCDETSVHPRNLSRIFAPTAYSFGIQKFSFGKLNFLLISKSYFIDLTSVNLALKIFNGIGIINKNINLGQYFLACLL